MERIGLRIMEVSSGVEVGVARRWLGVLRLNASAPPRCCPRLVIHKVPRRDIAYCIQCRRPGLESLHIIGYFQFSLGASVSTTAEFLSASVTLAKIMLFGNAKACKSSFDFTGFVELPNSTNLEETS